MFENYNRTFLAENLIMPFIESDETGGLKIGEESKTDRLMRFPH